MIIRGKAFSESEPIHVCCKRRNLWPVANRVAADITAKTAKHSRVDVAIRTQVQLLGPAFFGVQPANKKQHVSRKFGGFVGRKLLRLESFLKKRRSLVVSARS